MKGKDFLYKGGSLGKRETYRSRTTSLRRAARRRVPVFRDEGLRWKTHGIDFFRIFACFVGGTFRFGGSAFLEFDSAVPPGSNGSLLRRVFSCSEENAKTTHRVSKRYRRRARGGVRSDAQRAYVGSVLVKKRREERRGVVGVED